MKFIIAALSLAIFFTEKLTIDAQCVPECITCAGTTCSACIVGYYPDGGNGCLPCGPGCQTCDATECTQCAVAMPRMGPVTGTNGCDECAGNCADCQISGAGNCDICMAGNGPAAGSSCGACAANCQSCQTAGAGKCEQCNTDYNLNPSASTVSDVWCISVTATTPPDTTVPTTAPVTTPPDTTVASTPVTTAPVTSDTTAPVTSDTAATTAATATTTAATDATTAATAATTAATAATTAGTDATTADTSDATTAESTGLTGAALIPVILGPILGACALIACCCFCWYLGATPMRRAQPWVLDTTPPRPKRRIVFERNREVREVVVYPGPAVNRYYSKPPLDTGGTSPVW